MNNSFDLAFYLDPAALDLDVRLDAYGSLGIRAIGTNGWMKWRDESEIRRVGDRFRAHDMQVASCHSSIGIGWLDDFERSLEDNRRIVDCAAAWGCPSTVWHFRWPRSQVGDTHWLSWKEMHQVAIEELDRIQDGVLLPTCDYAKRCGVSINFENIPLTRWSENSGEILAFIRRTPHPALGFILDSGHAWASGYNPASVILEAGSLLRDTHFHDSLGRRGLPEGAVIEQTELGAYDLHLIPGLGTIPWMEVVRALWKVEFPGPVVFEGPGIKGHPDRSLSQDIHDADLTIRMWRAFEDLARYCPDPKPFPATTPTQDAIGQLVGHAYA